jgi:hypothetical protein
MILKTFDHNIGINLIIVWIYAKQLFIYEIVRFCIVTLNLIWYM